MPGQGDRTRRPPGGPGVTATVRVRQPAVAGLFYPGAPTQLVAAVRPEYT